MTSPMYNRERDREFIESRIMGNPWFMLDVCVSMSLLMVSAALFFRALNIDRPVVHIERVVNDQNRQNAQTEPDVVDRNQRNTAGFFPPPAGSSNFTASNVCSSANASEQPTNSSKKTR